MDIILKSGHIVKDIKCINGTRSPIGLWIWSTNQVRDQILTFDKISVKASEIAAIVEEDGFNPKDYKQIKDYDAKAVQEVDITDDDLPF